MAIDPSPSPDEIQCLIRDLEAVEGTLREYLRTDKAKKDPNFSALVDCNFSLLDTIADLSGAMIQIGGDNAGAAVDAINSTVDMLNAAIEKRKEIARNVQVVSSLGEFVAAIAAGQPAGIITAGKALKGALTSSP
jgi:hypothetical protein